MSIDLAKTNKSTQRSNTMATTDQPTCALCGEPMPPGEEMFKFHGYSGPCPKPPIPKKRPAWIDAAAKDCASLALVRAEQGLVGSGEPAFAEIIGRHAPELSR